MLTVQLRLPPNVLLSFLRECLTESVVLNTLILFNLRFMKDIFQEFKKATLRKHLAIGFSAFAFALGVNAFLFSTDTGIKMQASAVEAVGKKTEVTADMSVVQSIAGTDRANIRLDRSMQKVKEIEVTAIANPEAITFGEVDKAGAIASQDIAVTSNVPGVTLIKVLFAEPTDIPAGSVIATVAFKRLVATPTVINLSSPRATTADGVYELTSQGGQVQ